MRQPRSPGLLLLRLGVPQGLAELLLDGLGLLEDAHADITVRGRGLSGRALSCLAGLLTLQISLSELLKRIGSSRGKFLWLLCRGLAVSAVALICLDEEEIDGFILGTAL